jgi:hypothetical protein
MTWWQWTLAVIWGPTTVVGLLMIASVPARAVWRHLPRERWADRPVVAPQQQRARDAVMVGGRAA